MFIAEGTFALNYFRNNYVLSLLTWPELVNNGSCFCIWGVKYIYFRFRLNSRFQCWFAVRCCLARSSITGTGLLGKGCQDFPTPHPGWGTDARAYDLVVCFPSTPPQFFLGHLPNAARSDRALMSQARGMFGCCMPAAYHCLLIHMVPFADDKLQVQHQFPIRACV